MSKRVFVDSDIFIDVFAKRDPFFQFSAELLSLAAEEIFEAFTSPLVIANVFYVLQKFGGKQVAANSIRKLRAFVAVVQMDQAIVDRAINSSLNDFEDALEAFSAEQAQMDVIVTRNIVDYSQSSLSVMLPGEALAIFRQENS